MGVTGADYAAGVFIEIHECAIKYPQFAIQFDTQAAVLYSVAVVCDRKNDNKEERYKNVGALQRWHYFQHFRRFEYSG